MYNFKEIEKKWQNYWDEKKTFEASNTSDKEKYYVLVEFPYPSGSGLHVGHVRSYTALDAYSRMERMRGKNVLFPMGWDSFGAPAEQYAIKNHIHPKEAVQENIKTFKGQIKSLGISFDWSREFATTDPEYYKWTQWQFLQFYKHGMAYKAKKNINWCPTCKTGLSNEDSSGGVCERCGDKVVQKEKEQWMLKMSDYAEDLLTGLEDTKFADRVKLGQINWIGKSTGAEVTFNIKDSEESLTVYTTRPDTIFGATFMVVAPEHPIIETLKDRITNMDAVKEYQEFAKTKTEFERTELAKDKTGVRLEGIKALNPVNNDEVEIWISDYVMMGYGTGAIMAVPAHDDRDYEFAKKFNIPIKQVIAKSFVGTGTSAIREDEPMTERTIVNAVIKHPTENKYLCVRKTKFDWLNFVMGGIEEGETAIEAGIREVIEETGYNDIEVEKEMEFIYFDNFYAQHKQVNRHITCHTILGKLNSLNQVEIAPEEASEQTIEWVDADKLIESLTTNAHKYDAMRAINGEGALTEDGVHVNSEFVDGMNKEDSINKMIEVLGEKGLAKAKTNYRLQDWIFSRQRFWGEPIPLVYCEECGWQPVNEEDLPVLLPDVAEYEPTDDGESPLAKIEEWVNTTCPKCGKHARRETDTMPNWAGSSWYFLRYMDANNDKEFVSQEALKYWGKVDWYNGGMEHTARHLLYARFWNQFLYNVGLVPSKEPFDVRVSHGMILGADGVKMSKSKGNVINPDDIVQEFGADTLRTYEMFIGDYEKDAAWSTNSLKGCKKFLDRIWRLQENLVDKDNYTNEVLVNKTIKKVTEDLTTMKYNTAVSSLMIMLNEYEKFDKVTKADLRILVHLLNPIAPHITEEINEISNLGDTLALSPWPTYDPNKTIDESYEMVVQVNGKVRGKIEVSSNASEDEMKEIAMELENVKKFIEGKEIVKVITIAKKLVNIVVK